MVLLSPLLELSYVVTTIFLPHNCGKTWNSPWPFILQFKPIVVPLGWWFIILIIYLVINYLIILFVEVVD